MAFRHRCQDSAKPPCAVFWKTTVKPQTIWIEPEVKHSSSPEKRNHLIYLAIIGVSESSLVTKLSVPVARNMNSFRRRHDKWILRWLNGLFRLTIFIGIVDSDDGWCWHGFQERSRWCQWRSMQHLSNLVLAQALRTNVVRCLWFFLQTNTGFKDPK